MSEKRFTTDYSDLLQNDKTFIKKGNKRLTYGEIVDLLNKQQATIEHLKKRLYDFEKRKIIEESGIDEDIIPRIKLLRAELYGEKYD